MPNRFPFYARVNFGYGLTDNRAYVESLIFEAPSNGVSLSPSPIINAQTFHAATLLVSYTLSPSALTNTSTFNAVTATPSNTASAPIIASTGSFYSASVSQGVILSPPYMGGSTVFYGADVQSSNNVAAPFISGSLVFYGAVVVRSQAIAVPHIASLSAFYTVSASYFPRPSLVFANALAGYVSISPIGASKVKVAGFGIRRDSVSAPKSKAVAYEIPAPAAIVSAPRR